MATRYASDRAHSNPPVDLRRGRGDRGAVLVEAGLIFPLLFLLLFGIIEFGWLYAQQLNVRHGAREGARLAAVNFNLPAPDSATTADGQAQVIVDEICERMDIVDEDVEVTMRVTNTSVANPGGAGRFLEVTIATPVDQITGLFATQLDAVELRSSVEMRIERRLTWARASNGFTYTGSC